MGYGRYTAFSCTGTEYSRKNGGGIPSVPAPTSGCGRIGPHRLGTGYAGQCAHDSASRPCRQSPDDPTAGRSCARNLSALRPVNSLPVRWTGYLTRRRASVLPLLPVRFCVPSVTRWSLLPALYGTGFSSEQSAREMPDNITLTN